MLNLTDPLTVNVEALGNQGNVLTTLPGSLQRLDQTWATILLDGARPLRHVHWGARVRFCVSDDSRHFEFMGMVMRCERTNEPDADDRECACEVQVRLWDCRMVGQRRASPRRQARFSVEYCLRKADPDRAARPFEGEEDWLPGQCVDIGGGGMRLQTEQPHEAPHHLWLRFSIADALEKEHATFQLAGRVIRATPCGRDKSRLEMAVRFERLTVEDGLRLSAYLSK